MAGEGRSELGTSLQARVEPDTRLGRRMIMLGTGGFLAAATTGALQAVSVPSGAEPRWVPQFEAADRWLDLPHTRHRMVFDVLTTKGAMAALEFADNFFAANASAYDLLPSALGVVIVLRHMATSFGYNDRV